MIGKLSVVREGKDHSERSKQLLASGGGSRKLHPKGTPDISRAGNLAHRMRPKSV